MARRKSTTTAAPAPEVVEEAPVEQQAEQAEQVTLIGRLCADPVLRHTKSGKAVTTIRLAVNAPDDETTFHSVVVWNRTAEVVCEYLRKGRLVEITGRPQTRTWTDSDGNRARKRRDQRVPRPVHQPRRPRRLPPPRRRWRDGGERSADHRPRRTHLSNVRIGRPTLGGAARRPLARAVPRLRNRVPLVRGAGRKSNRSRLARAADCRTTSRKPARVTAKTANRPTAPTAARRRCAGCSARTCACRICEEGEAA